jgi:hypothetical protein
VINNYEINAHLFHNWYNVVSGLQSYYDSLIGYILKVFRPSVSVLTDHTALRQGPDERKRIKEMIEDK